MKKYKYEYKEKNLITLINNDKVYCENPMYAIPDFGEKVPCLLDQTDEVLYDYNEGLKYYYKDVLILEIKEKNEILNKIIDSIDVYIEKKKIREETIQEQENNENKIPEITVNTLNK